MLKSRESEFCFYQDFTVFIATWNVANFVPQMGFDLSELFNFEGNANPDIIVVGLQEHVELNASNLVVGADNTADFVWRDVLTSNVNKFDKYILVQKEVLVGIFLIVFVKEELRDNLSKIDVDIVKTGLAGTLGNKGAVVTKFMLYDSTVCFVNTHMEAGEKQNHARLMNLSDIHQKAFQQRQIKKPV